MVDIDVEVVVMDVERGLEEGIPFDEEDENEKEEGDVDFQEVEVLDNDDVDVASRSPSPSGIKVNPSKFLFDPNESSRISESESALSEVKHGSIIERSESLFTCSSRLI